jgi:PAS domain-containing protein
MGMKVLVYNDMDGHAGVYDISSEEQIQLVFGEIVSQLGGKPEDIEGMTISEISNLLEEEYDFVFDRSGGGRAYICEVKNRFKQVVEM